MILVTGGTGLLGSHLLYHLSITDVNIRALYRSENKRQHVRTIFSYYSDNPDELFAKIEWMKGDILDIPFLESAFENINTVYHTAAIVSFARSGEKEMKRVNIEGTANIVNLCNQYNVHKLCHVSSIATLSKPIDGSAITEEDYWNPDAVNSGYGISKNGAEMEVWRGIEEGLNAVIVNPSIIIGPGLWDTSSGKLFTSVKNGMKFYTKGGSGFVGVNDVAEIMILLMNSDVVNERFILNSENSTYRELFSSIALNLNLKPPHIRARKWMLSLAWKIDVIKSTFFGGDQRLNKDSARSANSTSIFSNRKIREEINVSFKKIDHVINEVSKIYLNEQKY